MLVKRKEDQILEKRINCFLQGYRQNLAILGRPFSGKTYLLEKTLKNILVENLIFIYVDAKNSGFSQFIRKILFSLLYEYNKKKTAKTLLSLDELILNSEEFLPETTQKIKNFLSINSKERQSFSGIFNIINEFIQESGFKIIMIIEEFSFLREMSTKILPELSKYILTQKNIMFILTSSEEKIAEDILSSELNLLFGNFERIYLENLSSQDSLTYLDYYLQNYILKELKLFIIELTDGFIFYIENIVQALLKKINQRSLSEDEVLETISSILFNPYSLINQLFWQKMSNFSSPKEDIISLIIAISQGYKRKRELASLLKMETKLLIQKLNKLIEEKFIKKIGTFYEITDRLFGLWVSTVFKLEIDKSILFRKEKEKIIYNSIKERYLSFKEEISKQKLDRFIELIQSFKDDTLKINKKSIVLPQIKRFKLVESQNRDLKFIIGEGKKTYLILAFKETEAKESDLLEFIHRCSYFRNKKLKKIFITLEKGEDTTRLIAKERKLFFWEKEEINILLKLYNMPSLL